MPNASSNTVYGIINDAMHDTGLLQEGEEANSEQLATNHRRLVDIVNLWQTQGLKLFLHQDLAIPLVAGKGAYTINLGGDVDVSRPIQVMQAYMLEVVSNARRPLIVLGWEEWLRLSQVSGNDGTVSSYFVDKQATTTIVHFWNTPDITEANNTAHVLIRAQALTTANLQENVAFPQEWRIALRWGLADDISTGQPQSIMDRCAQRATYYRELLENFDIEDAETRFAPDERSTTYLAGSFR